MLETIYTAIEWVRGSTSEKEVLVGPTFLCNKKGSRLQWVNLEGKLIDLPCEETALDIWAENVLRQNPNDISALYVKAYLLYRRGEYQIALRIINQALAIKPNNDWCRIVKRDILFSLKDFTRPFMGIKTDDLSALQTCLERQTPDAISDDLLLKQIDSEISQKKISPRQRRVIYHQRGELFFATGEYEKARRAFEKALKIESQDYYAKRRADESKKALKNLPAEHWLKTAGLLMSRDDFSVALECINEVFKVDPLNVKNLFLKSELYTRCNKNTDAFQALNEIIIINPENYMAWYKKAELLKKIHHEEEALICAYKSFALNPDSQCAFNLIIETESCRQGYEQTLKIIRNLLKLQPLSIGELEQKAKAFMLDVKELEALACVEEILNREGEHKGALVLKDVLLARRGRGKEALKYADVLFMLMKNSADIKQLQRALLISPTDEKQKATKLLSQIDKIVPLLSKEEQCWVYSDRHLYSLFFEKLIPAQNSKEKAREINITEGRNDNNKMDPKDQCTRKRQEDVALVVKNIPAAQWVAKYHLLMVSDNFPEALRCLDEALKLDPLNVETLFLKVKLFIRWNEVSSALKHLDEILAISPDNVRAWFEKATLLRKLGDDQQADTCARKAFKFDPAFMPAFDIIVDVAYKRRGYEKTLRMIRYMLKLESLNSTTLKVKAIEFMSAKKELEALACVEKMLCREREYAEVLLIDDVQAMRALHEEALEQLLRSDSQELYAKGFLSSIKARNEKAREANITEGGNDNNVKDVQSSLKIVRDVSFFGSSDVSMRGEKPRDFQLTLSRKNP